MELKKKHWSDITIDDYNELLEVNESAVDPIDRQVQILAWMCDVDDDEILSLPIPQYTELVRQMQWIYTRPQSAPICPETIILDGNNYRVTKDLRNITAGQYIDFQNLYRDYNEDKLADVLSCFIIPEDKEYNDGYDIELLRATIKTSMPILTAADMMLFFCEQSRNLIKATAVSLVLKTKMPLKQKMKLMKNLNKLTSLMQNGGGYASSTK